MLCSDTLIENYYTVYKKHLNRHDTLFGGQILFWLDEVMGMTIRKYSVIPFVTATIDNYQFLDAVNLNELLIIKSYVSRVGNKSVEIFSELSAFNIQDKSTRLVGLCTSTFSVRRDISLEQPLEKVVVGDNLLEKFVVETYNSRKNGELSMREFSRQYLEYYNKEN
ncbi:acyl-CoA thioesterase [Gemelliphila palaticanis]|uniref:Acyl-CoA thioesterase n=1 Tax=Gemelliphila palaticanis TaxID=81950 RepID=A0ABX2SXU7_9BACL|nr:acyl-CoA thioesterase [Gemella palaticanis]MBF0715039.1 acyl-CoA thioesterase [Gemella palaticanis]NYS46969.1 acyl-CoA thioesterase [Gemella palaticanis]